jgi:tRNA (guanine-N7-)-methyltransferase
VTAIVPVRGPHAPIRTYHPRQGRLSGRHRTALAELGPRLGLPVEGGPLDLAAVFGRSAPVVLEIGSGMGEATAVMAAADPERDYVAVEVHRPGIANLLALAAAAGLTNLRVVEGDALDLLRDRIGPGTLDAVHVFFPDPWPKARHHKRRLITPSNVELIRSRLRVGGTLHCATDAEGYAESMAATLGAYMSTVDGAPKRPLSKFEQRARDAGRPIRDLVFARTAQA